VVTQIKQDEESMLKFFRRIRRKLLDEGNLKRYFIYATGEILLVMIGILLALQVNNWNQSRQTNAIEQKMLIALQGEFTHNLNNLNIAITKNTEAQEGSLNFIKHSGPQYEGISKSQYYKLQREMGSMPVFYKPALGVLKDILNSGQLNTLSNVEIRRKLATWEADLENVVKREEIVEEHRDRIKEIILKESNLTQSFLLVGPREEQELDFGKYLFDTDSRKLLTNQELTNIVLMRYSSLRDLKESYFELVFEIEKILEIIGLEIKK
jgi:hypothetical protein